MAGRCAAGAAAAALILLAGCTASGAGAPQTADLGGEPIQVFSYQPPNCTVTAILLVFHGVDRNAGTYRDDAIPLAQRDCMLVIAPLFDAARFPTWRYQRGGIVHDDAVRPQADWTVQLVPKLLAWTRAAHPDLRPGLPFVLIGHSAGAQFLSRVAAYGQGEPRRIVIANPSTWVRARLDVQAPYGFGGAFPAPADAAALRRYLALPVTVLLGGADTGSRNLAENEEAEEQGDTRLQRGETVFAEAEQTAKQHGWPFNWRLSIVAGVGHNARRMFASDAAFDSVTP